VSIAIMLIGDSVLSPALARSAARAGIGFTQRPGSQRPVIRRCGPPGADGQRIELVPDADVPAAICTHMLSSLVRSLKPLPAALDGTVLAPAAGVCGTAFAGPIDAIRHGGLIRTEVDSVPCRARLLHAQQTRCWLLAATLYPADEASPQLAPGAAVRHTSSSVGADTARATQFMQDLGLGSDWPGLLLLDGPDRDQDGTVRILAAFTETSYVTAVVSGLLGQARCLP
jgi:hypothetical protein